MTFTSAHHNGNVYIPVGVACVLADSSNFGILGEQNTPALDADETPCKILMPLALSSAEKSVTVQKTQTVTDISPPCLSACVDKN